jgi:ribokinase
MKITTFGGAMIDTIAVIASDRIERMTMRNAETSFLLLEEGRKSDAEDISTHCGGGAVNAAVGLARQGHDVSALVKLGQDERAETILAQLSKEGVSTRFVLRDSRAPTGASVLVSAHDRNAAIFTFRGANALLEPKDLKPAAFVADLVYVSGLSNQSADCFPSIVEKAKAEGALVAVNPGIRQLSARQGEFRDAIARIDILALNRHEASAIVPWLVAKTGEGGAPLPKQPNETLPDLALRGLASGGFEISLARFFAAIHELGPRWIVVTDGKDGAYIGSPSQILHCPAAPVKIAGTAGAGDAFNSTFASGVAEGSSVEDAALTAAANSASVIAHLDTQSGLLHRDSLDIIAASLKNTLELRRWPL